MEENKEKLQATENEELQNEVSPVESEEVKTSAEEKTETVEAIESEPVKAEAVEAVEADPVKAEAVEAVQAEPVKAEAVEAVQAEPVKAETIEAIKEVPVSSETSYKDKSYSRQVNHEAEKKNDFKVKWNWGAFALSIWFGIANKSYLGLLTLLGFIPFIGPFFALAWIIIFGFFGEKWALENPSNDYRDEEEFRKIMDGWNRAGLVAFIVGIVVFLILIVLVLFFIGFIFHNLDPYNFRNEDFSPYGGYGDGI